MTDVKVIPTDADFLARKYKFCLFVGLRGKNISCLIIWGKDHITLSGMLLIKSTFQSAGFPFIDNITEYFV